MYSSTLISLATWLAVANAHGVILAAQGPAGPASVGFQVNTALARNCTNISPCQQDTTIIRQAEIEANIVNECGRTELAGNIDVGENTENELAANSVTKVTAGSSVTVTIHQVNADGAGPYVCDLDSTSNTGVTFQNLSVTNNVPGVNGLSQAKTQDFNITVAMPANLNCTGASTGNVCTVRCRNNALAGPFGGCFAVQQTDTTPSVNSAFTITTAQTLDGISKQINENNIDLPVAVAANQAAGGSEAQQGVAAVSALLGQTTVVSKAAAVQTPDAALGDSGAAAATTSAAKAATTTAKAAKASATSKTSKSSKNGKDKNNNGNAQRSDDGASFVKNRIVAGDASNIDLAN